MDIAENDYEAAEATLATIAEIKKEITHRLFDGAGDLVHAVTAILKAKAEKSFLTIDCDEFEKTMGDWSRDVKSYLQDALADLFHEHELELTQRAEESGSSDYREMVREHSTVRV